MPAPSKTPIANKAKDLLRQNGIDGENMPDLADALGEALSIALAQALGTVKMAPGVSVPPPAGPSAAPGRLV